MTMKLGEVLINEGLITRKQLDETLKSQVIFGGRLGTNLVEMGLVSEEDLLRCLSKQMEMPYVAPEALNAIPAEVIKLITAEMAEEYKIIPLRLEKKRLTVAMWDPRDLAAVDAISFITGFIIIPMICSELRLLMALEKYYGIKRELRYIQLSGGTGTRTRSDGTPAAEKKPEPQPVDIFDPSQLESIPNTPAPQTKAAAPPAAATPPKAGTPQVDIFSDLEVLELEEIQPEPEPVPPPKPAPAAPPKPAPQPQPKPAAAPAPAPAPAKGHYELDDMLTALAEAKDRDDIADAVIAYVGQDFRRVALFMIKGKMAAGWRASVDGKPVSGYDKFQLSLDELSILKTVADAKTFYLGPLLENPGNQQIIQALGGGTPQNVLLIPLMMMNRVVTIFYVDDGAKELGSQLANLQKIAGKTALAFEVLILKNKILG